MLRSAVLICAGLSCCPVIPAVAAAATVTVRVDLDNQDVAAVRYRAAAGERNRVSGRQVDDRTVRIIDPGAVVEGLGACRSIDPYTADCTTAGVRGKPFLLTLNVSAGDMNDEVRSDGPGLTADGGPGDDLLAVTSGTASRLDGGGGSDVLLAGSGDDLLIDEDTSDAADADMLDGRRGNDTVSYATRSAPVLVDLADARGDGEAGEADTLRSVESAVGGLGADMLRGDPGSNRLDGRAGPDRLDGRAARTTSQGARDQTR